MALYYFFSGKGGVGKTSVAAASALAFSKQGKKTLVISIDPAHSLADSFQQPIGGDVKQLQKNLWAVEIDPAKSVEEYKTKLSGYFQQVQSIPGLADTFDIAGLTPGIDEIAAFDKFLQYMHSTEWDIIIFDTAPTGHALRFLSLPDVLDSWVGKLITLRTQFSGVLGVFKKLLPFTDEQQQPNAKDQLETMKRMIGDAKKVLSDPKKTHFSLVVIPEAMSILESTRSLETLKQYHIPVERVVVNQVLPENKDCGFCQQRRKNQQARLAEIKKTFKKMDVVTVPAFPDEVGGNAMLERVGKALGF